MLGFMIQGLVLGINAAAAPGLFQTYLINQTLTGGWKKAAPITLAPLISDIPIVTVILLLLDRLPDSFIRVVGFAGGLFAFYLAWGLWRQWRKPAEDLPPQIGAAPNGGLWKGILMNALSPGPYTFWTLVNGPLLLRAFDISLGHAAGFVLGFYGAFIAGMLVLVSLFHQARRAGPSVLRGLTLLSIVILLLFGGILIFNAIV